MAKKLKILFLLFFTSTILVMFSSCEKKCNDKSNPDCENYNPCFGKSEITADFVCEVQVNDNWYEVDEVYSSSYVKFRAKNMALSYKWLLGSEEIKTSNFIRTGFPENSIVPCTLIIEYPPNKACLPNDGGRDTVIKNLKISKNIVSWWEFKNWTDTLNYVFPKYYGEYIGYKESNPSEKFSIRFYHNWIINNNGAIQLNGIINGLPYKDCTIADARWSYHGAWTEFIFGIAPNGSLQDKNLWGMHGDGAYNPKTGEIKVEFTHTDREIYLQSGKIVDKKDKFIGKKIK